MYCCWAAFVDLCLQYPCQSSWTRN